MRILWPTVTEKLPRELHTFTRLKMPSACRQRSVLQVGGTKAWWWVRGWVGELGSMGWYTVAVPNANWKGGQTPQPFQLSVTVHNPPLLSSIRQRLFIVTVPRPMARSLWGKWLPVGMLSVQRSSWQNNRKPTQEGRRECGIWSSAGTTHQYAVIKRQQLPPKKRGCV